MVQFLSAPADQYLPPVPDLPGSYLRNGFMFGSSAGPDAAEPGCSFSSGSLSCSAGRQFRLLITGNRKRTASKPEEKHRGHQAETRAWQRGGGREPDGGQRTEGRVEQEPSPRWGCEEIRREQLIRCNQSEGCIYATWPSCAASTVSREALEQRCTKPNRFIGGGMVP